MRLALGTAQFGMDYGISNFEGQVAPETVQAILRRASALGIDMLDTAEAYGNAEEVLGRFELGAFSVVGKTAAVGPSCGQITELLRNRLKASLFRLRLPSLYGFLLHAPSSILADSALVKPMSGALQALKDEGLVRKVGISTYCPQETEKLIDLLPVDIVQVPLPPIDRRWSESGLLSRMKAHGIEIHARSIFLQGLLLMAPEAVPSWARRWRGLLSDWQDWAASLGLAPATAALALTAANNSVSRAVIGVVCPKQVDTAAAALAAWVPTLPAELQTDDERLLNPSMWQKAPV